MQNKIVGLPQAVKNNTVNDLYTKTVDFNDLLLDESLCSRFIRLSNKLKTHPKPIETDDKRKLQKLFAYLLDEVTAENEKEAEKRRMFLCFNLLSLYPELLRSADDMVYILNHVAQNKRSWIKACMIQELHRQEELTRKRKKHDTILDASYIASELANIGIVLQEVVGGVFLGERWIEIGIAVGRYTSPLIYAFKVVQRGLKLVGRTYFGLEFAEDEVGINPQQNLWDGISAAIFVAVTVLLAINTPLLNAIAWLVAPVGLTVVWGSEYGYQNGRAAERLENMQNSEGLFDEAAIKEAKRIAFHKKAASWALLGVIIFLSLGMIATYAAGIPGLDLVFNENTLGIITTITGVALASLAAFRAGNFLWERKGKEIKAVVKGFFEHPLDSTARFFQFLGNSIVSAVQSIPGKAMAYWNESSDWQKVALILTLASVALSISVFTGGLPVIAGLAVAGACSLISAMIKYGPQIYKAIKESGKVASGEEAKPEPYDENQCNLAIDSIETTYKLKAEKPDVVKADDDLVAPVHTHSIHRDSVSSSVSEPFVPLDSAPAV